MNWLAHVFLADDTPEVRLGNLLADFVKGRERTAMSAAFQRGLAQHQAVDAFTDTHPLVHTSRARVTSRERHVAGILIDIFYDHFLAVDWAHYSAEPLPEYTRALYASIQALALPLPPAAAWVLERIIATDRLASYATLAGIEDTLFRLSQRLAERIGRNVHLEDDLIQLTTHYDALHDDFRQFFPQLQAYMRQWSAHAGNQQT